MLVWLLKDGENLPVQTNARQMRTWMLAEELVSCGHKVIWWSSTFSHQQKKLLFDKSTEITVKPGFKLKLIYAGDYKKNITIDRYKHHRLFSTKLAKAFPKEQKPDLIVSSFPIIDMPYEAVRYANKNRIPILIDIRDLWPDIFLAKVPTGLKGVIKTFLKRDFQRTKYLMQHADGLIAVSNGYLEWGLAKNQRKPNRYDRIFYIGYPVERLNKHSMSQRIAELKKETVGKKIFTFIGSFGHSYQLPLICDAAKLIIEQKKENIHFVIAGHGEQYEKIKKRAADLSNTTLLGWLDKFELTDLLKLSDTGIIPCKMALNTLPNKVFEFLSAGLPILSSLEGEMEDIIKKENIGFSYKCDDYKTLVNFISQMAENSTLLQELSQNASNLFSQRFDSKIIYKQYVEHLETVRSTYL